MVVCVSLFGVLCVFPPFFFFFYRRACRVALSIFFSKFQKSYEKRTFKYLNEQLLKVVKISLIPS